MVCRVYLIAVADPRQGCGSFELFAVSGGPKAASSDSVVELDKRGVAEPASEFAEGSGRAPPLDINASTPLLRSLAASSAPAVDSTHDQLLVDDFYMRPLLKGPLPHRDACDPFDRDYTDVQIRCMYSLESVIYTYNCDGHPLIYWLT